MGRKRKGRRKDGQGWGQGAGHTDRERKRTGNRTKGLRNKERVRSVQRDQEGKKPPARG